LGLTFTSAFEDAIVEGKKFSDVIQGIEKDIIRLIARKTVTDPLMNALGSIDIGGLFGGFGIGGGGNAAAASAGAAGLDATIGNYLLPGFATGGAFTVGGQAGTDSNVVAFRATRGERVSIETPGQQVSDGVDVSNDTTVQIIDQRGSGARPEVQQTQGPDGRQMIRVMIRDEVKAAIGSGGLDRAMAGTYGLRRRST
jgi:hypothetical protein